MKIKVNDDEALVTKIRKKLEETGGYCPCKLLRNEDTKCICKEFLKQETEGPCHCGLYVKYEV